MRQATSSKNSYVTLAGGVLGLVFAYAFLSRGFSTGSYWHYLTATVFAFLGVKLIRRFFKNY